MYTRLLFLMVFGFGLASAKSLLLLPVQGDFEKHADITTVNDLYREEIQNGFKGDVKTPPMDSAHRCSDKDCAIRLGQTAGADEVIFTTVKRLGNKWILSSTMVDVKGGSAFNQRGTAESLEDLEPVTRRVSDALLSGKSTEEVASLDNITSKEETSEPTRRKSLFTTGFSLGYSYPTFNTYSHLRLVNNSSPSRYEQHQDYSAMIRLSWLNSWEFRRNVMLSFDGVLAAPMDFGADINLQYMFQNTDITPFVGAGAGIHYIINEDENQNSFDPVTGQSVSTSSSKRHSGPSLDIQGGYLFFRTYDIHLITRVQYQVIMNSDLDNNFSFDVGVVYRPKEHTESHSSGWGTFWMYYLGGMLVLGIIGAASH